MIEVNVNGKEVWRLSWNCCRGIGLHTYSYRIASSRGRQFACAIISLHRLGYELTLESITVERSRRRKGVGKFLLGRLAMRFAPVQITAYPTTKAAAEWLLKCGFERTNDEEGQFIWHNPVFLTKTTGEQAK